MAVPSAADFYNQWVGGTGLQQRIEAAAKKETTAKQRPTWIKNALGYYQRAALEGRNLPFTYDARLNLPGFAEFSQQFTSAYQGLVTSEAKKQQQEIIRQQQEADRAAKELAAEQARIQAQLQAEQQAISQQQQKQAASIEAQLKREREAATKEQAALKAQFETERAQTEKLIGEAQVETQKQEVAAKREATTALNIGKQTSLAKLREQQKEATPVRLPQAQRRKTMIGQPGVASTRVSARPSIGGYGGTAPGRVNPTGLNI